MPPSSHGPSSSPSPSSFSIHAHPSTIGPSQPQGTPTGTTIHPDLQSDPTRLGPFSVDDPGRPLLSPASLRAEPALGVHHEYRPEAHAQQSPPVPDPLLFVLFHLMPTFTDIEVDSLLHITHRFLNGQRGPLAPSLSLPTSVDDLLRLSPRDLFIIETRTYELKTKFHSDDLPFLIQHVLNSLDEYILRFNRAVSALPLPPTLNTVHSVPVLRAPFNLLLLTYALATAAWVNDSDDEDDSDDEGPPPIAVLPPHPCYLSPASAIQQALVRPAPLISYVRGLNTRPHVPSSRLRRPPPCSYTPPRVTRRQTWAHQRRADVLQRRFKRMRFNRLLFIIDSAAPAP